MQSINLDFSHNGRCWIVRDKGLEVSAASLPELDNKLREEIKLKCKPVQGSRIKVNMDFDYSTIPVWMIQYHPYYIHRSLEFDY